MRTLAIWIAVFSVVGVIAWLGIQPQLTDAGQHSPPQGNDPSENCPYVGPGGC